MCLDGSGEATGNDVGIVADVFGDADIIWTGVEVVNLGERSRRMMSVGVGWFSAWCLLLSYFAIYLYE